MIFTFISFYAFTNKHPYPLKIKLSSVQTIGPIRKYATFSIEKWTSEHVSHITRKLKIFSSLNDSERSHFLGIICFFTSLQVQEIHIGICNCREHKTILTILEKNVFELDNWLETIVGKVTQRECFFECSSSLGSKFEVKHVHWNDLSTQPLLSAADQTYQN